MKTITMKNSFVSSWSHVVAIGSIASLALLNACGDNVTDNDPVATQAYEGQEDFPDCDEDYEGMFATVKSKQELYICTAEKWVNLTTGAVVSDKGGSGNTGCTSKELADKSGVTVICNGDSVAVLKYGKDGAKGSTGPSGDDGGKGSDGEDGHDGGSGKDAKMDPSRCLLKYSGLDVTVYDCADSVYVKTQSKKTSSVYSWKAFSNSFSLSSYSGYYPDYEVFVTGFEGVSGSLVRYEGAPTLTASAQMTRMDLFSGDAQMGGSASIEVTTAQTVTADKYRPFVGVRFTYNTDGANIVSKGGVCLNYSSEKEMNLLIAGEAGFLKASLPSTKNGDDVKDTVVDVLWMDFEPVEGADFEKVLTKAKYAYIEAVGGTEVGTYENKFFVHQFGDYGNCTKTTINTWLASINVEKGTATVSDAIDDEIEYNTVTIGEQTWLADNLRSGTGDCLDANDDADCSNSGRKYTWLQALGSAATTYGCATNAQCTSTLPNIVQGICPSGYHIATLNDWVTLFTTVGGGSFTYGSIAAFALFKPGASLTGTSASYAQNKLGLGLVYGGDGLYWVAEEKSTTSAKAWDFDGNPPTPYSTAGYYESKTSTRPVRCVKN